jgi:hypothetical protein
VTSLSGRLQNSEQLEKGHKIQLCGSGV